MGLKTMTDNVGDSEGGGGRTDTGAAAWHCRGCRRTDPGPRAEVGTYLWVDTICIQDPYPPKKTCRLNAMDRIYGLAALVVVAAAAGTDSNARLVGFKTRPRTSTVHERRIACFSNFWSRAVGLTDSHGRVIVGVCITLTNRHGPGR